MITSAGRGDGKTTTAANLAAAYGESGRSVLMVSFDLPRASPEACAGGATPGSASTSRPSRRSRWRRWSTTPRCPTSGRSVSRRDRQAASSSGATAARRGRALADVVIIDTAPLLASSINRELATMVDSVVAHLPCRADDGRRSRAVRRPARPARRAGNRCGARRGHGAGGLAVLLALVLRRDRRTHDQSTRHERRLTLPPIDRRARRRVPIGQAGPEPAPAPGDTVAGVPWRTATLTGRRGPVDDGRPPPDASQRRPAPRPTSRRRAVTRLALLGGTPAFPAGLPFARRPAPPLDRVVARLAPSYERGRAHERAAGRELEAAPRPGSACATSSRSSSCTAGLMLALRALDPDRPGR